MSHLLSSDIIIFIKYLNTCIIDIKTQNRHCKIHTFYNNVLSLLKGFAKYCRQHWSQTKNWQIWWIFQHNWDFTFQSPGPQWSFDQLFMFKVQIYAELLMFLNVFKTNKNLTSLELNVEMCCLVELVQKSCISIWDPLIGHY